MSLLTIVQNICMATALPVPTAVYTATETRVMQMRTLLRYEMQQQITRHAWSALRTTATATLTATSGLATVTLPADFGRFTRDGKIWSVTYNQPLIGPLNQNEWLQITGLGTVPGAAMYWRKTSATTIQVTGATTGNVITYDYQSKYPVIGGEGVVTKPAFVADDDSPRTSEILTEMGLHWRFLKANNLDYAEEMATYEREFERCCNADRGIIRNIETSGVSDDRRDFYIPQVLG